MKWNWFRPYKNPLETTKEKAQAEIRSILRDFNKAEIKEILTGVIRYYFAKTHIHGDPVKKERV